MSAKVIDSITLKEPIPVTLKGTNGEERVEMITTIDLREFKGKDMRAIDGFGADQKGSILLALMARICRQPIRVIDELGGADFAEIAEKVQGFLPSGLTTGETPSGS